MNARGIGMALLVLCVLGGLVAAFFSPVLAATLTLPATSDVGPAASARVQLSPTAAGPFTEATPLPTQLPSGVTILVRDTFQRPDQPLWGQSSDGQLWGGDANTNHAFSVTRHAGQISGHQGPVQATMNVTNTDAEILLSGSANRFAAHSATNIGVVLRWRDPDNWYKALIDGSKLQLLKMVHGRTTVLATQPFKVTGGTSYSIRFRALGSDLFVKAWSNAQPEPTNWAFMRIDTDLTSGVSGIRVLLAYGTVIRITSFVETSLPNTM